MASTRRSRWQFGLRGLLIAVAAICFYLAYPKFTIALFAIMLGSLLAGAAFTYLVFLPVQKISRRFSGDSAEGDDPVGIKTDRLA